MNVLLDTSTSDCHLTIVQGDDTLLDDVWHADRELAEKLLRYLQEKLLSIGKTWSDIEGIGLFKGPGSFTGLRIGASVMNAIAFDRQIAIVGTNSDDWQNEAQARLLNGENDKIVLPDYGRPANITKPRK